MNNIPTAEEILEKNNLYPKFSKSLHSRDGKEGSQFERQQKAMIEFSKLHVQAALEAASEKAKWNSESHEISFGHSGNYDFVDKDYAGDPSTGYKVFVNKSSILQAYPLSNIK